MDQKRLESYKKQLIKLREAIQNDLTSMANDPGLQNQDSGDVSGHVLHMADVATDMYDREFSLGLASNEREILHRIELALKKIEDKSFGLCTECSQSIGEARLKAIPYVETCLKCQEKIENMK